MNPTSSGSTIDEPSTLDYYCDNGTIRLNQTSSASTIDEPSTLDCDDFNNLKKGHKKRGKKSNLKDVDLLVEAEASAPGPEWIEYNQDLEQEFENFWELRGEELVLEKWKEKYGEYMGTEKRCDNEEQQKQSDENNVGTWNPEEIFQHDPKPSVVDASCKKSKELGKVDPKSNDAVGNTANSNLQCEDQSTPRCSLMTETDCKQKNKVRSTMRTMLICSLTKKDGTSYGKKCGMLLRWFSIRYS